MATPATVLVLGATGKTGIPLVEQLLQRGAAVRALVRSPEKLPKPEGQAQLSVTQCSSVLDLTDQELLEQVKGCEAVVSCLSHVGNPWAKPHDLCLSISKRICSAMQQAAQAETTGTRPKYLMMGTVLVPKADGSEKAHGWASTFMVGLLNTLLPPMYDHKLTAAYLNENMSSENPLVDHVVIRPNLLVDKPVSEYQTFDELQTGVFSPQDCSRANVAQFMCDLILKPDLWAQWKGKMPVIIDKVAA
ncbi:NAD(P)-bd_dom domain-containing protein [Durusdinium trenchii]